MLGTILDSPPAVQQRWPRALVALWALAVLAGLATLWQYANTSASPTSPRPSWPNPDQLTLNVEHPTLITFVHPHCPCTRASVEELARIVAQAAGKVSPWVVVFQPGDADDDWSQTDLVRQAAQIPGARVVVDFNGELARIFDITASGHSLLYSPNGELLFSGGITAARGHAGDNVGASAIRALLTNQPAQVRETPVFGCAIRNDSD